jgi:hypothetical protein
VFSNAVSTTRAFRDPLQFLCCLNWLKKRFYGAIAQFRQNLSHTSSWEYIDSNGNTGTESEMITYMSKPL